MAETTRSERGSYSGGDSRVSQDDFLVRTPNASTLSGGSCTSSNDNNMTTDYTLDEKYVEAMHDNKNPLRPRMQPKSTEKRKCDDDKEYARRTNNMLNIQSAIAAQDAFLQAGYDVRPYYGWLPGIAPLRIPASFIYPPTFFGFAPQNVDKAARKGHGSQNGFHPSDEWEESNEVPRRDNDVDGDVFTGQHDGVITAQRNNTKKPYGNNRLQGDARSDDDDDEGLELDEYDSNSISETSSLSPVTPQGQPHPRVANVSVIQETNCTVQKPTKDARGDVQGECHEMNGERKGLTKRGRASTRQIEKTEQYWDRRKKNNVSAKKSRDARRQREMITNQRSSTMETENLRLRAEVATLKEENERLKKELGNVM